MSAIGVGAAVVLGVTFALSGGLKLAEPKNWRQQSADLDVPSSVATVVPWYEVVLGAALLSGLLRPWPSMLAGFTLAVFTWFLARRMLDGTRPPCACFGSRSTRPLGPRHLARNGALILVAAISVVVA